MDASIMSPIPWTHRSALGWRLAFWRTLTLSTFRPSKLAAAISLPIDAVAAGRFRAIVVGLAILPAVAWFLMVVHTQGGTNFLSIVPQQAVPSSPSDTKWWWQFSIIWSAGATLLPIIPIGIALTFFLATRMSGLIFHITELAKPLRQRAEMISEYLGAPMAWLVFPCAVFAILLAFPPDNTILGSLCRLFVGLASLGLVAIPLLCWWNTLRVLAKATHCALRRTALAGLVLPVIWLCAAAIGLGIFPAITGLLWLMFDSVR